MPRSYLHLFDPHPPPILPFTGGDSSLGGGGDSVQVSGGGTTHSSSSNTASSIVIVIIVIASAVILSASLYLILRCITRRCNRSVRTFSAADDVVVLPSLRNRNQNDFSMADDLISSLPLFTYGSLTGDIAGGDCAVCLSKFEIKDQLRLLPLCCHAFHAQCIDAWLSSNQTCPLCRSTIHPTEEDVMNKILSSTTTTTTENNRDRGSFRVEIGNVSRRGTTSDSVDLTTRRSYSIGSFDYIVDEGFEVPIASTHSRGLSDCTAADKESYTSAPPPPEPPGDAVAINVADHQRSWLRDYIDRLASISSRTLSFRSSGRILTGSSRRSETAVAVEDLEASRLGEEIGELFRWLSGV
ncbi:E3 ubiquitin-protein ligase ATL4 [Impatiens glandulifera]|uniref:E3 ubiquitin-protein ligase ATL4 n=1 Tax=Impatiens glandulifera TaxID=253017 RepID=UPI001FB0D418|nr:E3 ubiquitin-protein ligase ATL4 [Impatiens glandulifera]